MAKNMEMLKQIFKELKRSDLFLRIALQQGESQKSAIAEGFKVLTSQLSDSDTAYLRQLRETIAQVQDENLRQQLTTILDSLFVNESQKSVVSQIGQAIVNRKQSFKFDPRPASDSTATPFHWGKFGQAMINRLVGGSAKNG